MDWLATELLTGFQKLLCLGLERQPAAEILTGTVQVWMETLCEGRAWDERRDAGRVRAAFVSMARTRRSWPAPADFLEALPPVEQLKALPSRPADPERAARAIEQVRKMLAAGSDR